MGLLNLFKKKINSKEIERKVIDKSAAKRSLLFIIGSLISALSFNLFFVPHNFVGGGLGGVAIILNQLFSLNSTLVILVGNVIFVLISILTLGFKKSLLSIIGASVNTAFVYFTSDFPKMINFSFDNVLLYVIAAGVAGGFGDSLVYKSGFNTGGSSIIAQVIEYFTKKPLGSILRAISIIIILSGGIVMGYTSVMYSLIIAVISTNLVDKILIGINHSKTFFIQTSKESEVTDFILNIIKSGVTELDSKGSYTHKRRKTLMCVVPREKYALLKSAVREIDPDAFIIVNDCYEVLGGTKELALLDKE